jgi:hypothetical protein
MHASLFLIDPNLILRIKNDTAKRGGKT